jgi:HSP20 family molecular chaperone IbpA
MTEKKYLVPPIDIYETDDKYIILADMPGATKDGIEISVENDTLVITGKVPEPDKNWKLVESEFTMNDYRRDIRIGNKVNREKIDARYENGVLTLELAKSEQAKPRKIKVNVA